MDLSQSATLTYDSAVKFTENEQCNAILEKLQLQREKGAKFCDVVFHIEDQELYAHRNVLAAFSPYFDVTFKFVKLIDHVNINNCKFRIFENFLNYIYTGNITIDKECVSEMIKLANQFMLAKLKCHCADYLEKNLNIHNCYKTKTTADETGLNILSRTCEAFILAHIGEIIEQNEVLEFQEHRIEGFLVNRTIPLTEEMKLDLLIRWVRYNLAERFHKLQTLLRHIQWSNINIHAVYALVRDCTLFTENEWCMYFILQILEEHKLLLPLYVNTLKQLKDKLQPANITQDTLMQALNSAMMAYRGAVPTITDSLTNSQTQDQVNKLDTSTDKVCSSPPQMLSNSLLGLPTTNDSDENFIPDLPDAFPETDGKAGGDNCNRSTSLSSSLDGLDSITPVMPDPDENKQNKSNKRKGIPIKVKISKAKLKQSKNGKRRGRPPKLKADDKLVTDPVDGELHIDMKNDALSGIDRLEDLDFDDFGADLHLDDDYKPDINELQDSPVKKKKGNKKKREYCDKCDFSTTDSDRLGRHLKKAHKDNTVFECNVCNFKTKYNREYYKHMKSHFDGPPFQCDRDMCDWSGDRIQQLLYHRMSHSDERPHTCSICNMKFRTKNNLQTHARCHTGEKPFECEVCHRCFATKGTLEQHSVTHSDIRPYLCDTCGFSTKYQSHLIAHRRIHSGDVFRCQYPNCKYSTPKRSQLACHMRSHLSIRSHICSTCGRGFVEKGHLVRHERIHLDNKPFSCDHCDYSSTRRDKLKEHVAKYHSDGASVKNPYKPRKQRKNPSDNMVPFPTINQNEAEAELDLKMQQAAAEVKGIRTRITPGSMSQQVHNPSAMLITNANLHTSIHQDWTPMDMDPTLTSVNAGQDLTHCESDTQDSPQKSLHDLGSSGMLLETQLRGGLLPSSSVILGHGDGNGVQQEFNVLERAFMGMLGGI